MSKPVIKAQHKVIKFYEGYHGDKDVLPPNLRVSLDTAYAAYNVRKRRRNALGKNAARVMKLMTKSAPSPGKWDQTIIEIGIDPHKIVQTIRSDRCPLPLINSRGDEPFESARYDAKATASLLREANHLSVLARIRLFLFLSYVYVLAKSELIADKEVHDILRELAPGATTYYLDRILNKMKPIHKNLVQKLCSHGWPLSRATLIVSMCMAQTIHSCSSLNFILGGPEKFYSYADINYVALEGVFEHLQKQEYTDGEFDTVDFSVANYVVACEPRLR